MTQLPEDAPPGTPPPGDSPPPDSAPGNPIKLSELADDWIEYGNKVIDRFQERAAKNADAVKNRAYGRDDLFSDFAWFWDKVAEDASDAAKYLREKFGAR